MARLHYGPSQYFDLDPDTARQVGEAIGGHATRGGWVTFSDLHGDEWSILVSAGIPIWLAPDGETRE